MRLSLSLRGCRRATSVVLYPLCQSQSESVDWSVFWLRSCWKQSWDCPDESKANSTEQNLLSDSWLWADECKRATLPGHGGLFVALVGQSLLFFLIPTL